MFAYADCGFWHWPWYWWLPAVVVWGGLGVVAPLVAVSRLPGRVTALVLAIAGAGLALQVATLDWPATAWTPDTGDINATICNDTTGAFTYLEVRSVTGMGWPSLPAVVFNAATNTIYGERIVGLWFSMVLVLVVAACVYEATRLLRFPAEGAVAAALAAATNAPLLWIGRHFFGLDLIVMQMVQIAAVYVLRRRFSLVSTVVAGAVTALCPLSYAATMMLTLYPLAAPWRRAVSVYAIAALLLAPQFWIASAYDQPLPFIGAFLGTSSYPGLARDACWNDDGHMRSLTSLLESKDGIHSSPGAPGTQTLTNIRATAVAISAGFTSPLMAAFGLAGIAPDLVGCGHGRSHRQLLVHLPFILSIGLAASRCPLIMLPVAAVVFVDGALQWWRWSHGEINVPMLLDLRVPLCADRRLPCAVRGEEAGG